MLVTLRSRGRACYYLGAVAGGCYTDDSGVVMLLRSLGLLLRKSRGRNQSGVVTELRAGDCYYGRAAAVGCYTVESIGGFYFLLN